MQQISILQREIIDEIDGLKEKMEANLDGLKDQMKANMDDEVVEDHIEHQQQVIQFSKDNLNLVQNQMKQQENPHHNERSSEPVTKTRTRQLRNLSISKYLSKWNNLPAEDSKWEDRNFI